MTEKKLLLELTEDEAYWLPSILQLAEEVHMDLLPDFDPGMQITMKHVIGIEQNVANRIKRLYQTCGGEPT